MKMDDKISKTLNLSPMDYETIDNPNPVAKVEKTDEENDYDYARTNFYNVIEKGTDALEQMLDVARASEHPRAYEVVSTLMKTLVDANKDLVSMGEKRTKRDEPESADKPVTNNNLFVGSTAELQQLLKDMRQDDG